MRNLSVPGKFLAPNACNGFTRQFCNEEGFITTIALAANNLVGTPPKELALLPALEYLHIPLNEVEGMDEVVTITKLKGLSLGAIAMPGPVPPEIGDLDGVEVFEIIACQLTGTLPN